jgi:NADH:ubiquinone oxidoreductase subunit 6 (subunit J)
VSGIGFLFGSSVATAVIGALLAVLAARPRESAHGLALAMLGVGGVLLSLGSGFLAFAVVAVLGAGAGGAIRLSAGDLVPPAPRRAAAVGSLLAGLSGLAPGLWVALAGRWPPAGGPRELGSIWIGFRMLTDHLLALLALALLLGVAGLGAALLPRAGEDA